MQSKILWITIFALAIVFYSLTMAKVYTYDALSYAYSAQVGTHDIERLLNPHHLGYHMFSYLYYYIWTWLGWNAGSLLPLQIFNVIVSALSLAMFYRFVADFTYRSIAYLMTLLLGVTNGYWLYSVEVEVYIPSILLLLLTFFFLNRWPIRQTYIGLALGFLWGAAILAHQMNVLFLPVILTAVLNQPMSSCLKIRTMQSISLSALATISIPYFLAIVALQLKSWNSVFYWLTWLAQTGIWGKLESSSLLNATQGAFSAIIAKSSSSSLDRLIPQLIALVLSFILICWRAYRNSPTIALQCMIWIVIYAIFFTWWEPDNLEFWINLLPPSFLLLVLSLRNLPQRWNKAVQGCLFASIFLLGINNWNVSIAPLQDPRTNPGLQKVMKIVHCVPAGSTVILNSSRFWAWLVYYRDLNVVVLDRIFLEVERGSTNQTAETGLTEVRETIDQAFVQNRNVFWLINTPDSTKIMKRNGINVDQLQRFFSRYSQKPVPCAFPLYQLNLIK